MKMPEHLAPQPRFDPFGSNPDPVSSQRGDSWMNTPLVDAPASGPGQVSPEALRLQFAVTSLPAPLPVRRHVGFRRRSVSGGAARWPHVVRRVIWYVDAVITVLLALRFALSALGANMDSFFGHFVLSVTAPLVWPFLRLFTVTPVGVGTLALVAIAVYALVAWGLSTLLEIPIWMRDSGTDRH